MTSAPRFQIAEPSLDLLPCRTRIPFRFGIHTLTEAPLATVTVTVTAEDGATAQGASSDLLVPKWFEKDPAKSPEEDSAALAASAEAAFELGKSLEAATVFDLWHQLHTGRVGNQPKDASDLLVRGFGVALLERAAMDAVCRLHGVSFHDALRGDLFGFRPKTIHPELAGWDLASGLEKTPASSIGLRHTVGLLDALRETDGGGPQDGFPGSLAEDIRRYGLTLFKIKVGGGAEEDLDRLREIAAVLQAEVEGPARFTLDGNEQFVSLEPLADLLEGLAASPGGEEFLQGLLFVEQPLKREKTFDPAAHKDLSRVAAFAPLLVDEADFDTWAFPEAVAIGYRGISVKACKGVFRALLNRGLCQVRGGGLFQSGEDLTNLPVRALQQDLALMASLGIPHVERNGHHYFRGLDHLPREFAESALEKHPGLYHREEETIALRVKGGKLDLSSVHCPGFGCALSP